MAKNNLTNNHNYLGDYPNVGALPTGSFVEIGDTAFLIGVGMQECVSLAPVTWQSIGAATLGTISLDEAYDDGGSGLGRVITVDSGPVQLDASAGQTLITRNGSAVITEINNNSGVPNLVLTNTASTRSSLASPTGINYSVGVGNTATITSNGIMEISASTDVNLNPSGNVQFNTAANTLTFEQSSFSFGQALKNTLNDLFHSGGAIGGVVSETSTSVVHALNSLGNALSKILGPDSPRIKYGVQNVPMSTDTVVISFTTAFTSTNYSVTATLENASPSAEHVTLSIKNKTVNDFTVELSDTTPTSNYKINWQAMLT